jgi:gliding motility-associated-like protein
MIKFLTRFAVLPVALAALLLCTAQIATAQTINDGCMRIRPYVLDSWLQEYEDPFAADEVALTWSAADNADLDGQGYRNDYGLLYLTGSNYLGWRTIFDGGADQAAAHPVVNLFDQTYGTPGTSLTSNTPTYLQISGTYTGDDCGAAGGCTTGILNCFGDDDDYCYSDVLTTTFNYRFAAPNQTNFTSDVFTQNHGTGGSPPPIGGGSNYGARIAVNWSSPIPIAVTTSTFSVCSGGSATLTATGTVFGGSYNWYTSTGTFLGSGPSITVAPLTNTTYRAYCTNGGIEGLCYKDIQIFASSNPITNNVITPSNPVGPFCVSGNPGLITGNTPSVTLPTWSYQWQTSTDGGANWVNVGGGTSAVLPYQYDPGNTSVTLLVRRLVDAGGCNNSSNIVTYVVEPNIGNNVINGSQTLCGPGTPQQITGSVPTGGNSNYSYQWQSASALAGPYSNILGANGQNYNPPSISSTTYYKRVVSGGVCAANTSNAVTITIEPVITGNTIGADQEFCGSGNPVALNPTGTLGGGTGTFTFDWQMSTDGGANWSLISGATGATYNPPAITQTTLYRRGVYSSGVCFSFSNSVTVTVYPIITNNTISADQASCGSFTAATLIGTTPGGGTGSYIYQWQFSTDNGANWNNVGGGGTSANYSPGTVSVTTQYRRVVTSLPCSNTSGVVTITITPPITVNTIGSDQTFCSSGTPTTLTGAVPTGGNGTFGYQWESSLDAFNWSPIGGASGLSYAPGNLTVTTYYHRIATSGSCTLTSNMVTITIVPSITGNTISADQTFCGSGDPTLLVGSAPAGGTGTYGYQWMSSTDNVTFTPIGGAISQNYDPATVSVTTYFRRDVTSSACSSNSNVVTVTVVPVIGPNTIDAYQRFCNSGDPAIITGNTPTGGTGSYTYQWEVSSNNITWSPILTATSASYDPPFTSSTVYYHRIVNSSVCSSTSNTSTVLILQLPQITQVTHTNVLCNGGNTGTITVSGTSTNGAAYFYLNAGTPQTGGLFTGLVAGNYNVFVTDDSACVNAYSNNPEVVTEPAVLAHTTTPQNASCDNVFDGSITVNVTGGTTPYTYSLNGGPTQPSNVFNGLSDGTYTVLVTDDNACTSTSSVVIDTAYAVYASLVSQTPVSCFGGVDGTVTVQLTGGVPPYSYSINGVQFVSSPTFTGLASGNYVVTLRDSKGCTDFVNVTITQPNPLTAQIDSIQNIGCNGSSSGGIFITVSGGNPAYTFAWSNGANTEDITGIPAGTYNVAITDTKGCTTSVGATITQPLPLFVNVASYHDLLCYNDSSGSIDITANGGVPPYAFVWSNTETTEDIYGLLPGTYSATVTDANNCSVTISQSVNQPTQLTSTISPTPVLCAGAASGSVDLTVSGGTSPYNYLWNNGVTTEDLTGVSGGLYTVVVHDANGCSITNSTTVTEPAPITITVVKTDVLCNGAATGAIDITVNGGTPTIIYSWSNGAGIEDLAGLVAGPYSVTITDGNGCTASASATITEPSGLVLNATPVDVGCNGGANGSIDITVQGGVFPYTFLWSNSAVTEDINGLSGGPYAVTVTDFNGCTISQSFTINEPTALTSTLVATNVTCFGASNGAIDLTVGGGTAPYSFLWNTFQTVEDLNGIGGGLYYVIITDANGCTKHDSILVTEAPQLVLSTVVTNVLCNGAATGAIDLTVSGGLSPYDYVWSNGAVTEDITAVIAGTYTVTVKDANNCSATTSATITQPSAMVMNSSVVDVACANGADGSVDITVQGGVFPYAYLWSNSAVTEDIYNVSGGTYMVTITDANGCTLTATFNISEPAGMTSSIVGTDVTCNNAHNGAADLTVNGGVTPYTFLWSTFSGTEDISGLDGGLYYVIITDAHNCEIKDSVLIDEPTPIVLTTVVTNISCFNANDGIIDLTVTGGTPAYTFAWSSGPTTEDLANLPGGQYVVTVTDNHSCTATTSADIVNPSQINANFITRNPLCYGDTSGRIDLLVSGGTPVYTFLWSNNAVTEDLNNVAAGTYYVTITDTRNCNHVDSATITEPGQIFTSGVVKNVTCAGLSDGFVDITAYAGTLPYTYNWSTLQSTEDIFNQPGGDYYVTVTDANGCQAVSLYIIREPLPLGISLVKTNVLCYGAATGTVAAIPTGGSRPYTYLWQNFVTDSNIVGAIAGHYVIQLTDSNGCFMYDSIDITQPSEINIAGLTADAICYGGTANITVTVTGGVPTYTYTWSTPDGSGTNYNGPAGTYTLSVTDANACQKVDSFTVDQGIRIIPNLGTYDPVCHGGNSGSITAITTGGLQPYSYAWSNSKTTISIGNLIAGVYTLTVTDSLTCTATASATINDPAPIIVSAAANGAKCFNTASGNVSSTVTGGYGPYTYLLNGVGQSTDTFTNLLPGDYLLIVTDVNGCQGTASFSVASPAEISVDLGVTQQVILSGMSTQLVANATSTTPILNYFWTPDSVVDYSICNDPQNCSNPLVAPRTTTTFMVLVMNADSCYASDTVTVNVLNEPSAFIPTAFTPNGDGMNDRFEFDILGATNIDISIFDRWGQRIYYNPSQTNGMTNTTGWDGKFNGKQAPFDTYVYQMKVKYFDNVVKDFTGTVTLMQ